jgi:hypothetical protein
VSNSKRRRRGPLPPLVGPVAIEDDVPPYVIATDPGCDHPLHREEVAGAMMALHLGVVWSGKTDMDCGCTLELIELDAASNLPRS